MMVLCPTHHDQVTKGAMPEAEQRHHKANPYNIRHGRAKGPLAVRQNYCAADFGSITVVGLGPFLSVGGDIILGFELDEENLQISLRLYSELDELLVQIERNEWTAGDPLPWDIEADWQKLVLREKKHRISLSIDATQIPMMVQGEFWRFGRRISVKQSGSTSILVPAI
jgi:hypothetical protein